MRIFLTVLDGWSCGLWASALGFGDRHLGRRQQSRDGIFEYVRLSDLALEVSALGSGPALT
jgi:hypothetical protein